MANRVREMGWLISLFSPLLSSSFSVIFFHVAPGDARKKSIYMDLQTEDPYWGKFVSLSLVSFGSASLHCSGYCWFTYLVASSRFLANLSYNFHGFVDGRLALFVSACSIRATFSSFFQIGPNFSRFFQFPLD